MVMIDATGDRVVYRGGCHYVTCDGERHTAHWWDRAIYGTRHDVQCACFCRDPEYLAHGFSNDIASRYLGFKFVVRSRP